MLCFFRPTKKDADYALRQPVLPLLSQIVRVGEFTMIGALNIFQILTYFRTVL